MNINIILGKIFGYFFLIFHWVIACATFILLFSNDLTTLFILDIYFCIIIQLNMLFDDCIINVVEDIYVKEEKIRIAKFVEEKLNIIKLVNDDKILYSDKIIYFIMCIAGISLLKTFWVLYFSNK